MGGDNAKTRKRQMGRWAKNLGCEEGNEMQQERDVGLRLGHYFFKSVLMATDAPCGHASPATLPFLLTFPFQGLCFSPVEV